MKRVVLISVPVLLIALLLLMRPAEGQSNLEDRVAVLETKVANLERQTGANELQPNPTEVTTHTITGTLVLYGETYPDNTIFENNGVCIGAGGYDDIVGGAAVTVRDGSGSTVAVGRLEDGIWEPYDFSPTSGMCHLPFTVSDVPDSDFYSVEVSHRGEISFSKADMDASGWVVELSLG